MLDLGRVKERLFFGFFSSFTPICFYVIEM